MKYWVYLNGEIPGQYEPEELVKISGFDERTLVCPAESELSQRRWQMAETVPAIVHLLRPAPPAAPTHQTTPSQPAAPVKTAGPEEMLDQTNVKLFRHISQIMNELEARRGDVGRIEALQQELSQAREETKAAQDENKKLSERIEALERTVQVKEAALAKCVAALSRAEEELGSIITKAGVKSQAPDPQPPANPAPVMETRTAPIELPTISSLLAEPRAPVSASPEIHVGPSITFVPPWKALLGRSTNLVKKLVSNLHP